MQKSIKEGFGLTVTEALWKGKPVVASAVGGIQLQIKNKFTDYSVTASKEPLLPSNYCLEILIMLNGLVKMVLNM
jgi:trehalose synthase